MIIDKEGFFDLTYCSNIHRGESWAEVYKALKTYIPKLKAQLAPNQAFGIGLRLSNTAAEELLQGKALKNFKKWLTTNQLYVMTINGFPYGGFHDQRVKEQVYAPDWTRVERRNYSLRLVKILAELTEPGGESGFSTSPLSYKPWLNARTTEEVYFQASIYLSEIVAEMVKIFQDSQKFIHIDIEAEPDCLIETSDEAIQYYLQWLIPIGKKNLAKLLKISEEQAETYLRQHVQICYDICHSSVEYEDAARVFQQFQDAGIRIGKVQVSAALKCKLPNEKNVRQKYIQFLSQFNDPVYLHQVIKRYDDGRLEHHEDLTDEVLTTTLEETQSEELRTHYHVPIFSNKYDLLESTQNDIVKVLKLLQKNKAARHLEIETYTWEVLPNTLKLDMLSSIQREYEWIMQHFKSHKDRL